MKNSEVDKLIDSLKVGDWSFSDEREFMENLYVGRFNYFLIVFSLFMTAGFANTFSSYKFLVFFVGALILFLAWLPLYRGYKKHDRIMRIMFIGNHDGIDWPFIADAKRIIESFWMFLTLVEAKSKDDVWVKEFEELAKRMSGE